MRVKMRHIINYLMNLKHGHHIALLYESDEFKFKILLPFIKDGLDRSYDVYYIAYKENVKEIHRRLRKFGINVEEFEKRGSLAIWEVKLAKPMIARDNHLSFYMTTKLKSLLKSCYDFRLNKMRVIFDDPFNCIGEEELISIEMEQGKELKYAPISLLCTYNLKQIRGAEILFNNLIETHELVILQMR